MSGLISVLAHAVICSAIDLVRRKSPPSRSRTQQLDVLDALLHMLCGTGLGLLFWLSWGLAAVVDVPWWVRGLTFGGLCWLRWRCPPCHQHGACAARNDVASHRGDRVPLGDDLPDAAGLCVELGAIGSAGPVSRSPTSASPLP